MEMIRSAELMRTVAHPGAPLVDRMHSVVVHPMGEVRFTVMAGEDLFAAVHDRLDMLDAPGGSFVMVHGSVARLRIMTGGPADNGLPMGFYGPHVMLAPLTIVAGAGGSGVDEAGIRFTHCHAAFSDAGERAVGGHLIPGETIAGSDGITVNLVPFSGGRFARRLDTETSFVVFHPENVRP